MTGLEIENKIKEQIPGAAVVAKDLTGGGDHWQVDVTAAAFQGLSMVAQHQMVYKALGEWTKKEIHALALNTIAKSG